MMRKTLRQDELRVSRPRRSQNGLNHGSENRNSRDFSSRFRIERYVTKLAIL